MFLGVDTSSLNAQQVMTIAAFLINIGIATVDGVHSALQRDGHDDETLAAIMDGVRERLNRHS